MKQKQALDILKAGRNVYLTGPAGSGKTHLLNQYIAHLKNHNINVAVTASTGIAATHIGGVTIHSWSGLGINDYLSEFELEQLEQKEYLWKRFDKTKVLIIDEVSMLSSKMLDTIERICRKMKRSDEPFGGMQVVLSGDFFQLPPIGNDVKFVNHSDAWASMDIRICYLSEQYRQKDSSLEKILNEIRNDTVTDKTKKLLSKQEGIKTKTRLYTHNEDVDRINEKELEKLKGKVYEYEMNTRGKKNLVANMKKSILAPEILKIKRNAVVMFVKNGFEEGYVNGTLGVVKGFNKGKPVIETFDRREIHADIVSWEVEEDGKVLASVEQLPIRLAWAITIHKSQGMSLDAAEIDLSRSFTPGQGYVALSRLRSLNGLNLKGLNDMALTINKDVHTLDKHLLKESSKWEKVIQRFSEKDMDEMHTAFVLKCGGIIK